MNEWKVYFGTDFYTHNDGEQPGKEITVNREFLWEGDRFRILSLYECSQGLVMDYCKQLDWKKQQAYLKNWREHTQALHKLSDMELELLLAENPAGNPPDTELTINGSPLQSLGSICLWWQPDSKENEDFDPQAAEFVQHYGLDQDCAWMIIRSRFLWETGKECWIKHLELHFSQEPVSVAGPSFKLDEKGQQTVRFTHPQTGTEHTLQVKRRTFGQIPQQAMPGANRTGHQPDKRSVPSMEDYIIPTNYEAIHYTLSPELADDTYYIRSTDSKGDQPISTHSCSKQEGSHTISVMGASSGSTSVFVAGKVSRKDREEEALHTAYSPVFFQPTEVKSWCITFRVKRKGDYTLHLDL